MPKTYEELLGIKKISVGEKELGLPKSENGLNHAHGKPVGKNPLLNSKPTDMELDFISIANSSDFQRFIVFLAKQITPGLFKGVSTRVTGEKMKQQFNDKRGDYRLVMTELKEKLKERSEKE